MRPDVNDFVVSLTRRDHTLAILFLHFADLFLRRLDLMRLLRRNDHVVDADRDARARRLAEPKLLQAVQRADGFFVAADLVTAPDEVAELRLADNFIRKTKLVRPDFTEDHAANGSL